LLKIEDFQEKDFDEITDILRNTFKSLICPSYTDKEKEFAEEILSDEFLSSTNNPAKVVRVYGMIKAGASLNGNSIFPVYERSPIGVESARELIKHIENLVRDAGNSKVNIYTLADKYKTLMAPFKEEGYETLNGNIDYPLNASSGEKHLHVAWMRKSLK
jgi:hypothetical protein